ncbi:MAG: peptidoglycan editing factor PgeF [Ruminococcaceae bacterium]|nr:peptidoglycan editing factor PgeF [Oscillospiraceae bacterium]
MHKQEFSFDGGRVLSCSAFSATGVVRHGFSTRIGGVSTGAFFSLNLGMHTADDAEGVQHNFSLFCRDLAIDPAHLVLSEQVHETVLYKAGRSDCGKGLYKETDLNGVDGLITDEPGVALATFYADCTPILLLDPKRRVIASVHSGWRGTVQKFARKAAFFMQKEYGAKREDILVAIGPSIKACHFEVDEEVYLDFAAAFGTRAERVTRFKDGKYYVDTDALNLGLLQEAGIPRENISVCSLCSYCEEDLFFSHRRSGGNTGRMCAVIELT